MSTRAVTRLLPCVMALLLLLVGCKAIDDVLLEHPLPTDETRLGDVELEAGQTVWLVVASRGTTTGSELPRVALRGRLEPVDDIDVEAIAFEVSSDDPIDVFEEQPPTWRGKGTQVGFRPDWRIATLFEIEIETGGRYALVVDDLDFRDMPSGEPFIGLATLERTWPVGSLERGLLLTGLGVVVFCVALVLGLRRRRRDARW